MSINELPDICLYTIFKYLNDADDLINCYKVCFKWSDLVTTRAEKVKYLMDKFSGLISSSSDVDSFAYAYHPMNTHPIDTISLRTLFGNLKILDLNGLWELIGSNDIIELVKINESLKGLILTDESAPNNLNSDIFEHLDNKQLEMVSCASIMQFIADKGSSVKQLHIKTSGIFNFSRFAECFPNLERLAIENSEYLDDPEHCTKGLAMDEMKIFEIALVQSYQPDNNPIINFIDSCPNLQSAYILLKAADLLVHESSEHKSLRDLVLKAGAFYLHSDSLQVFFKKYPNLKHLALRDALGFNRIQDEHIELLVPILPNLELLDVRSCKNVTRRAVDFVNNFCMRYGRSIKFYSDVHDDDIRSSWPQLSTRRNVICRGFDFMKHCFYNVDAAFPVFLDPLENTETS